MKATACHVLPALVLAVSGAATAACPAGGYATGQPCGAVGIGYEGCCDGTSTLKWCQDGQVCVKNCGTNPANHCCVPSSKGGCCDEYVMKAVCASKPECCLEMWGGGCIAWAVVALDVLSCPPGPAPLCESPVNLCGWDPAKSFYNCASSHSADPGGVFPIDCGGTCTPSCAGKACGPDGCGGVCGTCAGGFSCTAAGQCEPLPCEPDCGGKECGPDGCGGECGSCPPGWVCEDWGACNECVASCFDKECGGDGCGGSCGDCGKDTTCDPFGKCVGCVASCAGRECGGDGCGGSCGACLPGRTCSDAGICEPECKPDCAGKECGDDGCGGSCGACGRGTQCAGGACKSEPACVPDCGTKACGDDGCAGSCGECDPWEKCSEGKCQPDFRCEPSCADRTCGDDGCGGSCGECDPWEECTPGGACQLAAQVEPACEGDACAEEPSRRGVPAGCAQCGPGAPPAAAALAFLVLGLCVRRRRQGARVAASIPT